MSAEEKLITIRQTKFGKYANPWDTWREKRAKAAFYLISNRPTKEVWPPTNNPQLDIHLPVYKPIFGPPFEDEDNGIRLTWLGHATVLIHIDGVDILCDPIFSPRCALVGPKRYRPVPCSIDELPHIDAVAISHNHFDHMDVPTICLIAKRFPNTKWCIPMGCAGTVASEIGVFYNKLPRIWEALWWEEREIAKDVKLIYTPAQHWSGRNIFLDNNRSLWGSWTIVGPNHRGFFAGDTGYCNVFRDIGNRYGPFDVAAIPIGAYTPRELMSSQHVNPAEAVQIHKDIRTRYSVGIHWGTYYIGREIFNYHNFQ
ncbi:hypothetical protein ACTXT7_013327 [Hymenolepis weldensis]